MVDDHGGSDRQADDERARPGRDGDWLDGWLRPGVDAAGDDPLDEFGHPLIDSLEAAALREQAAGVLAGYHEIEASDARMLLCVLAEYLSCSVDALAAEVVRKATARRAVIDEPG